MEIINETTGELKSQWRLITMIALVSEGAIHFDAKVAFVSVTFTRDLGKYSGVASYSPSFLFNVRMSPFVWLIIK